jgi:hypothetical protein
VLDSIIELVKFVSGLGGLATSAFLVYDRIYRYRPSAFLIPADYKTNLRFKNVAAESIIIDEIIVFPSGRRCPAAADCKCRRSRSRNAAPERPELRSRYTRA